MDYLQYLRMQQVLQKFGVLSFKPYYKWITFNTLQFLQHLEFQEDYGFKPYYKWITFNTDSQVADILPKFDAVLNLIINGLPSIRSDMGTFVANVCAEF